MTLDVRSSAFTEGAAIPSRYTCDGENISPDLEWSEVPKGTQSIALIADDPDAPRKTWVHWVLFNLPPSLKKLEENVAKTPFPACGGTQGVNDSNEVGYDGPAPPSGVHRYFFRVYALDIMLPLKAGCTKEQLQRAMEGRMLADGVLMGRYSR